MPDLEVRVCVFHMFPITLIILLSWKACLQMLIVGNSGFDGWISYLIPRALGRDKHILKTLLTMVTRKVNNDQWLTNMTNRLS